LEDGQYCVTVTDANGCKINACTTVTEPDLLEISTSISNPITCNSGSDGAIELAINGGNSSYIYIWDGPGQYAATTQNISGLVKGTYKVTVTDAKGCSASTQQVLNQPKAVKALCLATTPASCFGYSDGTATVSEQFGVGPFTYLWQNGQTTATATGLNSGFYNVTVTDVTCGLYDVCTSEVEQPDPFIVYASVSRHGIYNISCTGASDGWIDLNTIGGNAGQISYNWNPSSLSGSYETNLDKGIYSVTATDVKGCTRVMGPIYLSEPSSGMALSSTVSSYNSYGVSCMGSSDGWICVNATGGGGSPNYIWSNGANTSCVSGLNSGAYSVTVSDNGGCSSELNFNLSEPTAILISGTVTDVNCYGKGGGEIDLTVVGGTPSYSYNWNALLYNNNGYQSTKEDLTNRKAGDYYITVTDNNGCWKTSYFEITHPDKLVATAIQNKVSCSGASDGSIDLSVSGGALNYTFDWSNGSQVEDPNGLVVGVYTVTVTDANGCTVKRNRSVTEPNPITFGTDLYSPTCGGNSDGFIKLTGVSGGTGGKSYAWTGSSSTNRNALNLDVGTYSVTVTDANNCTASDVWNLNCVVRKSVQSPYELIEIKAYPNPSNGVVNVEFSAGFEGENVRVYDLNGRLVLEKELWGHLGQIDLKNRTRGLYLVTIDFGNYLWKSKVFLE
jgi:hypothetical protein